MPQVITGEEIWGIKEKEEIKSIVELLVVKPQTRDQSNKEVEKPSSSWLSEISVFESTAVAFSPYRPH